jgi:hypothetical protein
MNMPAIHRQMLFYALRVAELTSGENAECREEAIRA